jgi:cellulose synthase/poly-beta-1,6-N-acetylglucosamine synthase-like glycosyltransferase
VQSLVSVVVPVYNGGPFLRKAIDSILSQTYKSIELIVVDDGSVDDSADIISSYGPRLQPIRQPNAGVAHARNAGIRAARGDFIAFLDQDDWWLPTKVAKQVELFGQDDDLGLVHTDTAFYHDPSASFIERINCLRPELLTGRSFERLLLGNAILNSSVMVRRSVLNAVGTINTEIRGNTIQDYDLWLRIAKQSSFGFIAEKLVVYRLHPGQGMWDARRSLVEELDLVERLVAETRTPPSAEMRARMAKLLDEVGVAHLDAGDVELARQCFGRALKNQYSWRAAVLLALALLPLPLINRLRRARAGLRKLWEVNTATDRPVWTTLRQT